MSQLETNPTTAIFKNNLSFLIFVFTNYKIRLGDAISEGTVVEWKKSVGDEVSEDEVVAVIETDKVTVDVRSTHVGVVVKLFAAVDDVVSFFFLKDNPTIKDQTHPA